jgi:hypothetical protein
MFALTVNFHHTVWRIPFLEVSNDNPLYRSNWIGPLIRHAHLAGSLSGLNIRWRMFAPVDPINWRVRYVGLGTDKGPVSASPLYWESSFESPSGLHHLMEFRERKAHLNSYYDHRRLAVIARQVCALHADEYPNLAAVVVEYQYQNLTPSPLDPRVPMLSEWMPWRPFETYLCP